MHQRLYQYRYSMLGFIALILVFWWINDSIQPNKKPSKAYTSYKVQFQYVAGIAVGNPVYVLGVPVGAIEDINLTKNLLTDVTFSLPKNMIIPSDAPFSIQTDSIFGAKKLNIQPARFLENRETSIQSKNSSDEFGESTITPLSIGATAYNAQPPLILNAILDAIIDIGKRNLKQEKSEAK